jgi:hypothetical protein
MKEIDLTKTPLSEIDLSRIDYEKSYVWRDNENRKDYVVSIGLAFSSFQTLRWNVQCLEWQYPFYMNGLHCKAPKLFTLHLFYKEVRECENCRFVYKAPNADDCYKCYVNKNHPQWQPKESVKENKHPIVIEYQNLGDTVKIVKIEGVMTIDEIFNHAGTDILNKYTDGEKRPSMYISDRSLWVWCKRDNQFYYHLINRGDKITKKNFYDLIDNMKLASQRLASLIKESKQPKIERIEI